MRGVGLTYRGKTVAMDPGFAVDWEFDHQPYDFEYMAKGQSYSISIPRAGNEHIFYHLGAPDNTRRFQELDGFGITIDGNLWQVCTFTPEGVSDDQKNYEGTLSTIDNQLFENKDKSIVTLIDRDIPVPAGSAQEILDSFNEDPNAEMVFPLMHFYGVFGDSPENLVNDGATQYSFFLPCFRIIDLLKWSLDTLGYSLLLNGVSSTSKIRNVLLVNNRVHVIGDLIARPTQPVSKYCLDITLAELIKELQFLLKVKPFVDPENKRLILNPIIDPQTSEAVDISDKLNTAISRKANFQNFSYSYALEEDELLSQIIQERTGTDRGDVDDITDFQALGSPAEGDHSYVRRENAYWHWRTKGVNGTLIADLMGEPFEKVKTGDADVFDFQSRLSPCRVSRYTYRTFDNGYDIIDNGSGKVRIDGVHGVPLLTLNFNDYKIKFTVDELSVYEFGEDEYADILASTGTTIDIDVDFSQEIRASRFTMKLEIDYYVPIIGAEYHHPESGVVNEDFNGRILIWHGIQPDVPDTGTYPFASAADKDSQLVVISDITLNTSRSKGLKERVFDPIANLLTSQRIVKFLSAAVPAEDLKKLFTGRIARFSHGLFKLSSFKGSITKDGIRGQEIEGYRL